MDKCQAFRYSEAKPISEVFSYEDYKNSCSGLAHWSGCRFRTFCSAQDSKLVDAAKKEGGKVVVYGSLENDTMDLIAAALKKKTGLETDYWREAANKVTDRVANESRAGRPLFDVVLTTKSTMHTYPKRWFFGQV